MHTPGPWKWRADMVTSKMGNIAQPWKPDKYMEGDQEANARLIAAAPELLEALQALGVLPTEGYCFCPIGYIGAKHCGECIDANKAIDKATRPTQ